MKLPRRLISILVVLLLVAGAVIWIFAQSIGTETINGYVSQQLTSLTSQQSKINGRVSWQFLPRPGIKMTSIEVGSSDNKSPYEIKIDNLFFNLRITSLLQGKIIFNEVKVDGFTVRFNPENDRITTQSINPLNQTKSNNKLNKSFAIEHLMLSRGRVTWMTQQTSFNATEFQIKAEQLNLKKDNFPFQLKSNLMISSSNQHAQGQIHFKGSTKLSSTLLKHPQQFFDQIVLDGQLTVLDMHLQNLAIKKLSANTHFKAGELNLNPLAVSLYQGEAMGDLRYNHAEHMLTINQTATNLDSNQLIRGLFSKKFLKGSMDLSLHAQTDLSHGRWQDNTVATGNLMIKDGAFLTVNLLQLIDDTNTKINKFFVSKDKSNSLELNGELFKDLKFSKGNTPFKLLSIEYQLHNHIINSNLIVLQADRFQIKGNAVLNLEDFRIESNLQTKVTFNNKQSDLLEKLIGGSIAISIKGTLTNPEFIVDLQNVTKNWLTNILKNHKKHLKLLGN